MAFTMAYLNFKKGLKMTFGPLGVKLQLYNHCDCRGQGELTPRCPCGKNPEIGNLSIFKI
jgi:hypothetical protein